MPLAQVEEDDQVPLHDNLQEQDHHQEQEQESAIIDDEPQQMQYEEEDLPPQLTIHMLRTWMMDMKLNLEKP